MLSIDAAASRGPKRGRLARSLQERFGGATLITGASSGIGEAFARLVAERGADVILVARRIDKLQVLASDLEKEHGGRAMVLALDLTAPDGIARLRAAVANAAIPVGLLINNAGVGAYGAFADQDAQALDHMLELNCHVPLALTRAFVPEMIKRGQGGIVFVGSMASYQPTPRLALYGASKAFVLSLGEALWAELRPAGLDVLALCPGHVETEFSDHANDAALRKPGRHMSTQEVARIGLDALGKTPSIVPGVANKLLVGANRLVTRRTVAALAARVTHPRRTTDG